MFCFVVVILILLIVMGFREWNWCLSRSIDFSDWGERKLGVRVGAFHRSSGEETETVWHYRWGEVRDRYCCKSPTVITARFIGLLMCPLIMSWNGSVFPITGTDPLWRESTLSAVGSPGGFPSQRAVMRIFNIFFVVRLKKMLNK